MMSTFIVNRFRRINLFGVQHSISSNKHRLQCTSDTATSDEHVNNRGMKDDFIVTEKNRAGNLFCFRLSGKFPPGCRLLFDLTCQSAQNSAGTDLDEFFRALFTKASDRIKPQDTAVNLAHEVRGD